MFNSTIANGGTSAGKLTFDASYSGTATINGTNTYSGATTLSSGTFVLGNKQAFGTGAVAMNGGSISASVDLSGGNAIGNTATVGGGVTFTGTNPIEFNGAGLVTVTGGAAISRTITNNLSGANLTFSGGVSLSSNSNAHTLIIAGTGTTLIKSPIINGGASASGVQKNNATGKLTLTAANTYTGTTQINNGILQLGNGGTSGSLSTASTISFVTNATGNFTINRSNAVAQGTDFSSSPISGPGSLTQAGTSSLTLNAANTYSGGTTISSGSLVAAATGALGTGNVTVQSSAVSLVIQSGVADAIGDTGTLNLAGGGTADFADQGYADLGAGINERIGSLQFNGVTQGSGLTYGSTASIAIMQSNEYFTGSGILTVGLLGDFNADQSVDAGDYVRWRQNPTLFGGSAGYNLWRANFGNTAAASGLTADAAGVPEPSSIALLMLVLAALARSRSPVIRG